MKNLVYLITILIWIPLEYFRLGSGYRGNINESFSELTAFWFITIIFTGVLSILPWIQDKYLPHERACLIINCAFVFF